MKIKPFPNEFTNQNKKSKQNIPCKYEKKEKRSAKNQNLKTIIRKEEDTL